MIELRNVKKEFNKYKVFENVNMSFPKNGLFAILGKSGSGKSTILNIISGYLEPDAGEVLFNGNNISGFNDKEKEIYRKEIISFIFQDFFLIDDLNVLNNVLIGKAFINDADSNKAHAVLEKLHISHLANKYPNELSGGERQRVAIARALFRETKIILADEPTGNLDDEMSKEIHDILKDISKEKLVIVVSHDLNIKNYADEIINTSEINNSKFDFIKNEEVVEYNNDIVSRIPINYGNVLLKRKRKVIYSSFSILMITLFTLLISLSFTFINPHYTEYKMYKKANINEIAYKLNGFNEELENHNYNSKYSKLAINDFYFTMIALSNLGELDYSDGISSTNLDHINNIIIDDNVADNKMIISNYIMESLIYYKAFSSKKDVLDNCVWELENVSISVEDVDDKVDLDYYKYGTTYRLNYIKVSNKTFDLMNDIVNYTSKNRYDVNYNNSSNITITYYSEYYDDTTIDGRLPENDDEIVVSSSSVQLVKSSPIVGSTVTLYGKEYKIVGKLNCTFNSPLFDFMFTEDECLRFAEEHTLTIEKKSALKGIIVSLDDKDQSIKLFKDMYRQGIFSETEISNQVYDVVSNIYISRSMVWLFTLLFCIIEIALVILTLRNVFNSLEREITIFFSFGASIKESFLSIMIPLLKPLLIFGVASIILFMALMPLINVIYSNILNVKISALTINPFSIIISFVINLLVFLLSGYLTFVKLKKKNLLDLLYNRN